MRWWAAFPWDLQQSSPEQLFACCVNEWLYQFTPLQSAPMSISLLLNILYWRQPRIVLVLDCSRSLEFQYSFCDPSGGVYCLVPVSRKGQISALTPPPFPFMCHRAFLKSSFYLHLSFTVTLIIILCYVNDVLMHMILKVYSLGISPWVWCHHQPILCLIRARIDKNHLIILSISSKGILHCLY